MIRKLNEQMQGAYGRFFKRSLLLAVGFAVARLFGLTFSLLLGRALPTEEYGFIQYSILLAGILSIGTQPFTQHTFARFVSIVRQDTQRLSQVVSTAAAMLGGIVLLTLIVITALAGLSSTFNVGAVLIFLCLMVYYAYYGLARGFEDSGRLSAVFIASNIVQFIAIFIAYSLLNTRQTLPALAIYGLSYLGPVLFLTFAYPLPIRFRREEVDRTTAKELFRFSVPVWLSHALFALTAAGDVFILISLAGSAAAGAFVFTRTLGLVFDFLPTSISTLIMPRVAASAASPRRMVLLSSTVILASSAVMGIVFLLVYPWFIQTFIQPDYLLPMPTVLVMILAQVAYGLHGVLTGVVMGQNRTIVELFSRVIMTVCLYVACYSLIPTFGIGGAALANLITAVVALLTYPLLISLLRPRPLAQAGV